ncbi:hypothetical protein GHT06_021512 [Daphnia sinensis]|uniref:Zasp-like motif domain-containing protein n=1 Tax=Daphnia sinensis TaxID=1820382 RepID=A0AAD5PMY1_9CRUS|nr:hypothetical protein GHT06_021512 [Daphnia sinensis]
MATRQQHQPASKKRVALVHNQYNSPLGLYSTEEVSETLQRHTRLLGNGAIGVDFSLLSVPNLARSEVYKMLSQEEPQLRYLHQQHATRASSLEYSDRKRVAWPPTANSTKIETIETRNYGYDSGVVGMTSLQHRDVYVSQKQGDYKTIPIQKQGDYNTIPVQKQGDYNMIPVQKQVDYNTINHQKQQYQNSLDDLAIQQTPKVVPPPPPPRGPRKPMLRSSSDAQDPFTSANNESAFVQYSDLIRPSVGAQQKQEPSKEVKAVRMSSRRMPEPFASDELVGERTIIAKPSPPPGLLLRPAAVKKTGFAKEAPTIRSESFFKRGTTPVRMLGDMVWPPKGLTSTTDKQQLPAQSPGMVRRQQKNYRDFFSQNQLPPNFPTYRAPPGTQHFGLEEGENATPIPRKDFLL